MGSEARDAGLPFGRYMLRELIARGGMGEVFRAVAIGAGGFEKPVVVKRILPQLGDSGVVSEMFIEEARLMSRLVHPNIVQVIDFGRGESDDYFLVMELVDGVDLRTFYKSFKPRTMPPELALFVAMQALRGLHHAHVKADLVHRDVSPGNVLLSSVGEVKVADFGVALVAKDGDADGEPTTLAGKLGYMAPEQHRGDSIDERADVFSAAVVLFLMLTGDMPFEGKNGADQQRQAAANHVRSLADYDTTLPDGLDAILQQALAADRERRFVSARAMSRAIEAVAHELPAVSSDDLAEHVERVAQAKDGAKRVLALSEGMSVREGTMITRSSGHGAFTMKVTITGTELPPDPDTEVSSIVEKTPAPISEGPPPSDVASDGAEAPIEEPPKEERRWWLVALPLAVAAAVGSAIGFSQSATTARSMSVSPPAIVSAKVDKTPQPPQPVVSASASAEVRVGPSPGPGPTTATTTASTVHLEEPPVEKDKPGCVGSVLLAASHGWFVSGGPKGTVEAPGQYNNWRCGSYALSGKSRLDGRTVVRGVTIREGRVARADFE